MLVFGFPMLSGYLGKEFAVVFSGEVAVEEPGNGIVEFRFFFGFGHERCADKDFAPGVEFAFLLLLSVLGQGNLLGDFRALLFELFKPG